MELFTSVKIVLKIVLNALLNLSAHIAILHKINCQDAVFVF